MDGNQRGARASAAFFGIGSPLFSIPEQALTF